jgi:hypothetical protein
MKQNVGALDRIIRLIVGVVIIVVGVIYNSWWGLIGVAVFLTGLIGWCGAYKLFGINTCKAKTPPPTGDADKKEPSGQPS